MRKIERIKNVFVGDRAKSKLNTDHVAVILAVLYFIIVLILQKDIVWGWMTDGHVAKAIYFGVFDIEHAFYDGMNLAFFYSLLVAIMNLFLKDIFLSGKLVNIFSLPFIALITYKLGKEVFNSKVGLFAEILVILTPTFFDFSIDLFTDTTFTLFFLTAIFYLIKAGGNQKKNLTIAGVFAGVSLLTKPSGLLFVIIAFFYLLFYLNNNLTDRFKRLSYFIIPFILVASPIWMYSLIYFNTLIFVGNAGILNVLNGVFDSSTANSIILMKEYPTYSSIILNHPDLFLKNIYNQTTRLIASREQYLVSPIIFIYIFISGVLIALYYHGRKNIFLLLSFFSYIIPIVSGYVLSRYVMPIVPIIQIYTSFMLFTFFDFSKSAVSKFKNNSLTRIITVIFILILFGILTIYALHYQGHYNFDTIFQPEFLKDEYHYLIDNTKSDDLVLVMTNPMQFPRPTDSSLRPRLININNENIKNPADLFKFIRNNRINYLVFDNYYNYIPDLNFLLNFNNPLIPKNFEIVFNRSYKNGIVKMVIFKIKEPENLLMSSSNVSLIPDENYHAIDILNLVKIDGMYVYQDNFTTPKYKDDSSTKFIAYASDYKFAFPSDYDIDGILEYSFVANSKTIKEFYFDMSYYIEGKNNYIKIYYKKRKNDSYTLIQFLDEAKPRSNYNDLSVNSEKLYFLIVLNSNKSTSTAPFDSRLSGLKITFKLDK